MSLNESYKLEFIEHLKKCSLLVDKSDKYQVIDEEFNRLFKEIKSDILNGKLSEKDPLNYIDNDGNVIVDNIDLSLNDKLIKLGELRVKLNSFGWKDDIARCVNILVDLFKLKDMEKAIIEEFGKVEGYKIIIELKREIMGFELDNNINFFSKEVINADKFNDLKILYTNEFLTITDEDNVIDEYITLYNYKGDKYNFKKSCQIAYNNELYFIFEYLDIKEDAFYTYKIKEVNDIQVFIMEEDDDILDVIFEKDERLSIETQIKKNKKV